MRHRPIERITGAALLAAAIAIAASASLAEWLSGSCPLRAPAVADLAAPERDPAADDTARFLGVRDRMKVGVPREMTVSAFRDLYHLGTRARVSTAEQPDHALAGSERLRPGAQYQIELTPKVEDR